MNRWKTLGRDGKVFITGLVMALVLAIPWTGYVSYKMHIWTKAHPDRSYWELIVMMHR